MDRWDQIGEPGLVKLAEAAAGEPLLEVNLSADYPERSGVLDGVSFTMRGGEILGLIGRSGSGKSTIALAILRLLELRGGRMRGTLRFRGRDLLVCDRRALREIRGREIGFVPQSPMSALNPALHLETQFREAWRAHRPEPWASAKLQVRELLAGMALPTTDAFLRRYPRQLSVGQAQRVTIAMAVLHRPKLLIADEATSALDPTSQTEILDLFSRLNRTMGTALLYISHDMSSVARLCQTVAVLEGGRLIEAGPATRFAHGAWHPLDSPVTRAAASLWSPGRTAAPPAPPGTPGTW